MPVQNSMHLNGKGVDFGGNISDIPAPGLQLNLSDDYLEVRGFGKPITKAAARKMALDHVKDCLDSFRLIKQIDTDTSGQYAAVKNHPDFQSLKSIMDQDNHVVSGVFGKEIILQLLSQKNAEGIRYTFGKFNGKMTIILTAVSDAGTITQIDGDGNTRQIAQSEPLGGYEIYTDDPPDPSHPIDGEVHENSKTIGELLAETGQLHDFIENNPEELIKILFGKY